jgi:hypothetical protein
MSAAEVETLDAVVAGMLAGGEAVTKVLADALLKRARPAATREAQCP